MLIMLIQLTSQNNTDFIVKLLAILFIVKLLAILELSVLLRSLSIVT